MSLEMVRFVKKDKSEYTVRGDELDEPDDVSDEELKEIEELFKDMEKEQIVYKASPQSTETTLYQK